MRVPRVRPPQHPVSTRAGQNTLPTGLKFVSRVLPQSTTEALRIRFALDRDRTIDLPLTAETLIEMARALS